MDSIISVENHTHEIFDENQIVDVTPSLISWLLYLIPVTYSNVLFFFWPFLLWIKLACGFSTCIGGAYSSGTVLVPLAMLGGSLPVLTFEFLALIKASSYGVFLEPGTNYSYSPQFTNSIIHSKWTLLCVPMYFIVTVSYICWMVGYYTFYTRNRYYEHI